jgi:hypothetical protein
MNRTIISFLCIPATVAAFAYGAYAAPAQAGELPETTGAFYAISVRSIDEAIVWYTEHLGFEIESQGGNDQRRGALLSRPGAVLELGSC